MKGLLWHHIDFSTIRNLKFEIFTIQIIDFENFKLSEFQKNPPSLNFSKNESMILLINQAVNLKHGTFKAKSTKLLDFFQNLHLRYDPYSDPPFWGFVVAVCSEPH